MKGLAELILIHLSSTYPELGRIYRLLDRNAYITKYGQIAASQVQTYYGARDVIERMRMRGQIDVRWAVYETRRKAGDL